jgi:alpha-D-ribose 1-methylphosphonate 5-triphosphate synthase subunit PhnG
MPDSGRLGDEAGRRRWMGVLAKSQRAELEAELAAMGRVPVYRFLREPEIGLAMVRGRIGGTGAPFNLGEMTMTRCAVRLADGARATGLSFVAGRDTRRAELAAVFDALLQDPRRHDAIEDTVITPIEMRLAAQRRRRASDVAATQVDFFTLVRE